MPYLQCNHNIPSAGTMVAAPLTPVVGEIKFFIYT